jgi:hypothetical protein
LAKQESNSYSGWLKVPSLNSTPALKFQRRRTADLPAEVLALADFIFWGNNSKISTHLWGKKSSGKEIFFNKRD